MDIPAYLFVVNRNNGFRLSEAELNDVISEVVFYTHNKSLNDDLSRKTALRSYHRHFTKKIKQEQVSADLAYLEQGIEESAHEKETKRLEGIRDLNLNKAQKKIVELLIHGFDYKEVRKKLRLSDSQLKHHVYNIRLQNAV